MNTNYHLLEKLNNIAKACMYASKHRGRTVLNCAIRHFSMNPHLLNMKRAALYPTMALLMVLSGCALNARYPQALDPNLPEAAEASEIDHRLILLGDAGAVERDDLVMTQLTRIASELDSVDVTVVFLGDNIYEHGLPPTDHNDYELARMRLEIQIDAAHPRFYRW